MGVCRGNGTLHASQQDGVNRLIDRGMRERGLRTGVMKDEAIHG